MVIKPTFKKPPAAEPTEESKASTAIEQAWTQVNRYTRELSNTYPNSTFQITESLSETEPKTHILGVVEKSSLDSVVVVTELQGEFTNKFLRLPGSMARTVQVK